MKQVYQEDVWHPSTDKIKISRTMTIKGKKNSKVKIITNKKKHEFWGNTFRRKRQMSEFFSDSAFGSQSDTLIILIKARTMEDLMEKYRVRLVIDAHSYQEPPPSEDEEDNNRIAFMQDPEA